MRKLLWLTVLIVIGVPTAAYVSAWLSLDRARAHSAQTAELPLLGENGHSGLVRIPAGGREFRARVAGLANDGPGLMLLHGFPETSAMWAPLLETASAAGYRVVAFDQRGYSPGARPEGVEAYASSGLAADVLAVADTVGFERFHLVGHDWGAVVGWSVTAANPARVLSWVSLSIPHPAALQESRGEGGAPAYVRMLRLPGLAEVLLSVGGMAMLRNVNPVLPPDQLDEYVAVFSEPGALTAILNWYRAIPWSQPPRLRATDITPPSLWIFGSHEMDLFINEGVRALQRPYMKGSFKTVEIDAGHWLIQEQPTRVVEEVMAHLEAHRSTSD